MIIKNVLFIFITFSYVNTNLAFKIHSFYENLYDTRRPEYIVLDLLKKTPLNKNVNFLAAPWHILHFNSLSGKRPNLSDLQHLKIDGGFAVCSHDDYQTMLPLLKKIGIDTLFTCGIEKDKNQGFNVLPMPYNAMNSIKPATAKDIYYSFIGSPTHFVRNRIFQMPHPKNTVVIRRDKFHYNITDAQIKSFREKEYAEVLSRSRFSLCPRGASPGSIRFWESLQAGAIPVLISDDYELPRNFNWQNCIIQVQEKDIEKIPEILTKISLQEENNLRRNCFIAYKRFSGKNLASVIRKYYSF